MSELLNLLGDLMSTAARLHGYQGRSHVCQKLIELVVGYPVNEVRPLVVRAECGNGSILLGEIETNS